MNGVWTVNQSMLGAALACVLAVGAHAQAVTEREIEGIEKRFAIASEHLGEGEVQLHSRADTDDGSLHEVHTFSCLNQTYRRDFSGVEAPSSFPLQEREGANEALAKETEQASLAAHACEEHGYPLLRTEW